MNPNRPFDLSKLDFEKNRLAKRRKLVLFSLPVCLIVGFFALKFLSIPTFSMLAKNNYEQSSYDKAIMWFGPLDFMNWFETFKSPFNSGNAYFKQSKFSEAEKRYRKALETVPKKYDCAVRVNLALSLEAQADERISAKDYDKAILFYDEAKAVIYDGQENCGLQFSKKASGDQSGDNDSDKSGDKPNENGKESDKEGNEEAEKDGNKKSDKGKDNKESDKEKQGSDSSARALEKTHQRIIEKSDSAKQARNNDKKMGENSNNEEKPQEPSEDKMKQLEDQIQKSQKNKMRREQSARQYRNFKKYDRKYDGKNW